MAKLFVLSWKISKFAQKFGSVKRILTIIACVCLCISVQAYTVVIDAGHGGKDAGALGAKSKEKNINLAVALELGRLIERNCSGVKVIYTRKTDTFVELHERANIANKAKADLFISIHANSTAAGRKGTTVRGTETYTLGMHRAAENLEVAKRENTVITLEAAYQQKYEGFDPKSSESYIIFELMQDQNMAASVSLAKMIQKQFSTTAKRVDRGVHQAGLLVLSQTSMPAVLVELGYINNAAEERYMTSSSGVSALANSIYKAFVEYKK